MRKSVKAIVVALLLCLSGMVPCEFIGIGTVQVEAASKPKAPYASAKSGTYEVTSYKKVALKCKTKDAAIYYSVNGGSFKKYKSKLKLKKDTVLVIYSKKDGKKSSKVTYEYKIKKIQESTNGTAYAYGDGTDYTADYTQKTFYKLMSDSEKKAYALLYAGILALQENIDVSEADITADQLYELYYRMIADCPELYWLDDTHIYWSQYGEGGSGKAVIANLHYTNTAEEISGDAEKIANEAATIIEAAGKSAKDIYDYVKYFHDEIIAKTKYAYDSAGKRDMAGIDDILLGGKGLCTAYARTFAYLCQKSGIPCVLISGDADNGTGYSGHAWNKVYLDGEWYCVDCCWDDPYGTDVDTVVYTYFLRTDKDMEVNHDANTNQIKKDAATGKTYIRYFNSYDYKELEAAGTKYDYYERNNIKQYSSTSEALDNLAQAIKDNLDRDIYTTKIILPSAGAASYVYSMLAGVLSKNFPSYSKSYNIYVNTITIVLY